MIRRKGNTPIEKEYAHTVEDGRIGKELPLIEYNGELKPLFSVVSPETCTYCGSNLYVNKRYNRYIISQYGILEIPVTYWRCGNKRCKSQFSDTIIGVEGSRNYSSEFMELQYNIRYTGKCSLHNNRRVGELITAEGDYSGRSACPATLWSYEQRQGSISLQKIQRLEVPFNGTLYCDGYWVKNGWRKVIEGKLGKKLTNKEWKKLRYKNIYVIATEDKVVLDFIITNVRPSYLELAPLFQRIKKRIGEDAILKVVSDEDTAIIDAVSHILPKATHSFCVFHQLQNLTRLYLEDFKTLERLPEWDKVVYEKIKCLILSDNAILSTSILQEILAIERDEAITTTSKRAIIFARSAYHKNRRVLEKGFVPETNNVMEQIFSFINDFVYQARSFKILTGLKNWAANMFNTWDNRIFSTGKWRGVTPIERAFANEPG